MDENKLREHLNEALDRDRIRVSEELISKTLKKASAKDAEMPPEKQKKSWRQAAGRMAFAAAGLLIIAGAGMALRLGGALGSRKSASSPMEAAQDAAYGDTGRSESAVKQEVPAEAPASEGAAPEAEADVPQPAGSDSPMEEAENAAAADSEEKGGLLVRMASAEGGIKESSDAALTDQLKELAGAAGAGAAEGQPDAEEGAMEPEDWKYWIEFAQEGDTRRIYIIEAADKMEQLDKIYEEWRE